MPTKDFSKKREDIALVIDGDTFHAYPGMAADTLIGYAAKLNAVMTATAGAEQQYEAFKDILRACLLKDSYERFMTRLANSEEPIDFDQLSDVCMYLFELYGLRPTQPSAPSPSGQPDPGTGTTSTESTPAEVSISVGSPPTGS